MRKITIAGLLLTALVFNVNAQKKNKPSKKAEEVKVIMIDSKNGKVTTTEETYSLKDKKKIEKLLKEKGIELDFDEANGIKISIDDEGDVDKKVIIKTIDGNGNSLVTEEHIKVITMQNGDKNYDDGDVKVTVNHLDNAKGKMITITSVNESFTDQVITVNADGDDLIKGKTMLFVRKNSSVSETNLPNSINEVFDDETGLKNLNLFPNPTNENFNMQFTSEKSDHFELSITDSKGARVYEKSLKNFKGEFNEDFDLSKYDAGIYFFNLVSGKQNLSKKIVVQ